jgi:hypothetical protein
MDLRDELDAVIGALLVGRITYSEFQEAWWDSYINRSADVEKFTLEGSDHYGAVNERQEWTADPPDEASRKYGWIDSDELRAWLTVHEMVKPPREARD